MIIGEETRAVIVDTVGCNCFKIFATGVVKFVTDLQPTV